ncbi:sensor histidine kinase [Chitinophaga agri]|uniref:HAMP domain-containing histidine kinase n=1 Tax=Chitinophaga agri TaxID=2703787 RepID=A0A6B9ZEM0_9BACT|nr:HAMP domain-containing sensor histidine kinase [Chitinophaga agri]QHS60818.1 HAMP domain-containing histidine kinase [Chitinophaga agri]
MKNTKEKLTQKVKFPFCLSDDEILNPMQVFYSFCDSSDLRTETHRLDRVLEAISRSGYESNKLCYQLVDTEYRRLIEAAFLLTNRKTMEEISMERFLGLFAHEVKTQIGGATLAVEALIEKVDSFSSHSSNIAYYLSSLKAIHFNINQIMSNMITTVQFNEDGFALRTDNQQFEVGGFIDECTVPYYLMNETMNKNLIVKQDELQHRTIITDKIKLRQIIQNLLSNAYRYSTGKDIQLVVTTFAEYITFSVISLGHTIPPDEIKDILRLFYKVKPGGAGDGIGLYLCQIYVESLNGNIKITSSKGITSFTISIPCEKYADLSH